MLARLQSLVDLSLEHHKTELKQSQMKFVFSKTRGYIKRGAMLGSYPCSKRFSDSEAMVSDSLLCSIQKFLSHEVLFLDDEHLRFFVHIRGLHVYYVSVI